MLSVLMWCVQTTVVKKMFVESDNTKKRPTDKVCPSLFVKHVGSLHTTLPKSWKRFVFARRRVKNNKKLVVFWY
jgi:hypothetical protein